jgi:Skp family chaperone for outer membrane proteins
MKTLILLLALALAGCTSIQLPDGATVTRLGYGAIVQYQRSTETLPDGSTMTADTVTTRSEADAATLRAIVEEAANYARPNPF